MTQDNLKALGIHAFHCLQLKTNLEFVLRTLLGRSDEVARILLHKLDLYAKLDLIERLASELVSDSDLLDDLKDITGNLGGVDPDDFSKTSEIEALASNLRNWVRKYVSARP